MSHKNSGFGILAIVIIIAVAAAVGGGVYYKAAKSLPKIDADVSASSTTRVNTNSSNGRGTSTVASANVNVDAEVKVGPFAEGSIRSLLNANKDIECSVQYSTTTSKGLLKTQGSVFITGNNMRGDFTMTGDAAATADAHIIRQGDSVVAWSGKQGAKFTLSSFTAQQPAAQADANSQVSLDQNVSYRCMDWDKDLSKFVAPADVRIYDITSIKVNGVNVQTNR